MRPAESNHINDSPHAAGTAAEDFLRETRFPAFQLRSDIHSIFIKAQKDSALFLERYDPAYSSLPTVASRHAAWVTKPYGATTLHCIADNVLDRLVCTANPGPIAHDFRHMAIKDPISGLGICVDLRLNAEHQIFLIATLAHDLGRLVEHQLIETSLADIPTSTHGILSFHYLQQILNKYPDLPPSLADDLLYAVLVHSDHMAPANFMLTAVRQADRAHMIGPEGVVRCLGYDVGLCNLPIFDSAIDRPELVSTSNVAPLTFATTLLYFCQQLPDPPLGRASEHFEYLRNSTRTFVELLLTDGSNSDAACLSGRELQNKLLQSLRSALTCEFSPDPTTTALPTAHSSEQRSLLDTIYLKLLSHPEAVQRRFVSACSFLEEERAICEKIDIETLLGAQRVFHNSGTIAERVAAFVSKALSGRYSATPAAPR